MGGTTIDGVEPFDLFDMTQSGYDVYQNVVSPLRDRLDEEMDVDVMVIDLMGITNAAHRGHKLQLFMIDAA